MQVEVNWYEMYVRQILNYDIYTYNYTSQLLYKKNFSSSKWYLSI